MREKIAVSINASSFVMALDFAPECIVADIGHHEVVIGKRIHLTDTFPAIRAQRLRSLAISTVLCGAISDSLSLLCSHYGITVFAGLSGTAETLINAYTSGDIDRFHVSDFQLGILPGCRFRHRRRRCGRNRIEWR